MLVCDSRFGNFKSRTKTFINKKRLWKKTFAHFTSGHNSGGVFGAGHLPSTKLIPTAGHSTAPGNLPSIRKKTANSRGLAWGGGGDGHSWN